MTSSFRISIVFFALLQSAAVGQNLLSNGGFELPVIATNSIQSDTIPTFWTGGSFNSILNGSNPPFPTPIEGQQATAVATSESLSQVFTTVISAEHELRWFDAVGKETGGPTTAPYSVAIVSEADSQVVFSANLDAFHPEEWLERIFQVNLTPGDYLLQFSATGNSVGGVSPILDGVAVTVVPEPTSLFLTTMGLSGAGVLRRRRR